MKKILLVVAIAASLSAQTKYENNIRPVLSFPGANVGVKVAAAMANCPAGGCRVIDGSEGAQTVATDVFSGITKPITLELGGATYAFTLDTTIPANITTRAGQGAKFCPAVGKTLTIAGPFLADLSEHFPAGCGTVRVTYTPWVFAEWWEGDGGVKIAAAAAATNPGAVWDARYISDLTAASTITISQKGKLIVPNGTFSSSASGDTLVTAAQGIEVACDNTANNYTAGSCIFGTTHVSAHIMRITAGAASVHDLDIEYLGTSARTGGSGLKLDNGSGGNFFNLQIGLGTWIPVNQAEGGSVGHFSNIRVTGSGGAGGATWTVWQMGGCIAAGNPAQLGCSTYARGITDIKLDYVVVGYTVVMGSGYVVGIDAGVDTLNMTYVLLVASGQCAIGTACGEGFRIHNTTFAGADTAALDRPRWIRCWNCLVENSSVNAGGITTEPAVHIKSGRSIHFTGSTAMVCGAQCVLIEPGALADGAPVSIQDVNISGMISATAGKEIIKVLNSTGDWSAVTPCGLPVCDVKIHHNALYGAGLAGGIDAVAVAAAGGGGSGYTAGDVVDVVYPGATGGKVNVLTVDGSGKVLTVSVNAAGTDYPTYVDAVTGGTGTGLQLNVTSYGGVYSTVYIAAGVKKWSVEHNNFDRMIAGVNQLPNYFVEVAAGASDQYEISHNSMDDASRITGDILDGGTGQNKIISPNAGTGDFVVPNFRSYSWQDSTGAVGAKAYTGNGSNELNIVQLNNSPVLLQLGGNSSNLEVRSTTRLYSTGVGQLNIEETATPGKAMRLGVDTANSLVWIQGSYPDVGNWPLALNANGGGVTIGTITAPPTDGLRVQGGTTSVGLITALAGAQIANGQSIKWLDTAGNAKRAMLAGGDDVLGIGWIDTPATNGGTVDLFSGAAVTVRLSGDAFVNAKLKVNGAADYTAPSDALQVVGSASLSGDLKIGSTSVITSGGVLQNVTAAAGIITSGALALARGGTATDNTAIAANYVFAGPTSGGASNAAFRALVSGDIPDLSATYLTTSGGATKTCVAAPTAMTVVSGKITSITCTE